MSENIGVIVPVNKSALRQGGQDVGIDNPEIQKELYKSAMEQDKAEVRAFNYYEGLDRAEEKELARVREENQQRELHEYTNPLATNISKPSGSTFVPEKVATPWRELNPKPNFLQRVASKIKVKLGF